MSLEQSTLSTFDKGGAKSTLSTFDKGGAKSTLSTFDKGGAKSTLSTFEDFSQIIYGVKKIETVYKKQQ
jgi:hypothetical protein